MKIINRYVLKEHVGPFLFALSTLTSLMLLQYIARRFGDLVGKGLSWQVITEFLLLSFPFTVAMTLPMAVLVGVLYAFSRLASENEITAMRAGGISSRALMIPSLFAATGLAFVMVWFNDQVLPAANHRLATLQMDIVRTKPTFALRPQVINTVKESQLYLRAARIEQGSNQLGDVIIYDVSDAMKRKTIFAESGVLALAPNRKDLTMHLHNGMMLSVANDRPDQLSRIYFKEDQLKVKDVMKEFQQTNADTTVKGEREMSVCEMQKEYERASMDVARARASQAEAEWMMKNSAGIPATKPRPVTLVQPARGIGRLYCDLLARVGKLLPKKVGAQQPAKPQPAAAKAPPPRQPQEVNTPEMQEAKLRYDDARRRQNRMAVEIQKKFSLAAACIVFVLIGAPIALRFPRGGVGLVMIVGFVIFAAYYVALIGGEELANRSILSPFWAMWGANVIFLAGGLLLMVRMGNESATARGGGVREMADATRAWFARQARYVGIKADRRART